MSNPWDDFQSEDTGGNPWDDFQAEDQFPGMPSPSMRNQAKPWQLPQVGNVDQLTQFQQEQAANEPTPPMARDFSLGQQDAPDPRPISQLSPDEAQTRMERVLRPTAGGAPQRTPYIAPDSPLSQAAGHLAGAAGVVMPIQAAGGVVPAALDALYGFAGASAGGAAGRLGGSELEKAKLAPQGTSQFLSTVGAIGGGLAGGIGGPAALRFAAENGLVGGKFAALARLLGGSAKAKAAEAAAKVTAGQVSKAEEKILMDQFRAEEKWARSVEKARKAEAAKRAMAEAEAARSGIKVENAFAKAGETAAKGESTLAGMAEADATRKGIKVENAWEKAQTARAKVGSPADDMPLSEAKQRAAAEAQSIQDQMDVENQWLNVNPATPVSAGSKLEQDLIKAGVAPRVAREMADAAKAGGVPASDVTGRVEGASRRAVADGVGKSSVPKTDDLLEGDFIDPKHVSVVPDAPAAGQRAMATNLGGPARPGPAPTAPQDLEEARRQTLEEARITKALPKAKTPMWGDNFEKDLAAAGGDVRSLASKYNFPLGIKTPAQARAYIKTNRDFIIATREMETGKKAGTAAETVPSNYESTAAQTRSVEALRKEVGAVKAARKLGIPKDQVNQVRLDAGDRGSEALGEAAGLPEGARRTIVSKLSTLKSREEVMAYIRRANNDKARLQIEGIAVGMGLL